MHDRLVTNKDNTNVITNELGIEVTEDQVVATIAALRALQADPANTDRQSNQYREEADRWFAKLAAANERLAVEVDPDRAQREAAILEYAEIKQTVAGMLTAGYVAAYGTLPDDQRESLFARSGIFVWNKPERASLTAEEKIAKKREEIQTRRENAEAKILTMRAFDIRREAKVRKGSKLSNVPAQWTENHWYDQDGVRLMGLDSILSNIIGGNVPTKDQDTDTDQE